MFDTTNTDEILSEARKLFIESCEQDNEYQRHAFTDFGFHDGDGQWTDEEKSILEEEKRPCLTFNLTKSSIDLVMGINEDERVRFTATPVEPTDDFLCEVINDLVYWLYENSGFEESENEAFRSACISGRGWVAVDFSPDPKRLGHLKMTLKEVPVHEVHRDPASRARDLNDCDYIFWDKWISVNDFKLRYPKHHAKIKDLTDRDTFYGDLNPITESDVFEKEVEGQSNYDSDYDAPLDSTFFDRAKRQIRVIHMEYRQPFKRYFAQNPLTGAVEEFNPKDLKKLKLVFKVIYKRPFEYTTIWDTKIRWLQFNGKDVLFHDDSPLPFDGFSLVPCFAFTDSSKRSGDHFGIVRLMRDPQREVNKRWSQTLNLLNQQVQPGLYAESDAFLDAAQAEESIKTPGSITWVQSGAITEGKFQERQLPNFPNAPIQLEEFAQNLMRKITGINPDLLGMDRGRQEPGIVIRLRQQQGMVLLKPLFHANRQMKKENFKRIVSIVMAYMPDEQIRMILGDGDRYVIRGDVIIDQKTNLYANIRDLRSLQYNIDAEETPGNRSARMLELSVYMDMMQAGFPVDPMTIIERLDIPASAKKRWIEYIAAQQKAQQEMAEKQYQVEMMKAQGKIQTDQLKIAADTDTKEKKIAAQREKDTTKADQDDRRIRQEDDRMALDFTARMAQVDAAKQNNREGKESARG